MPNVSSGEDVGFTFDPQPFLGGLKQVSQGLGRLGDRTVAATKSMGHAFMGALLKVEAIKYALKGAFNGMKQYMPEIDKTFSIAKDIFLKNLLWPLRQAIAPYLQKLLDWVRDNRAAFVKWGAVLANVFKVAVALVKTLWGALKNIISLFQPFINKIFKGGLSDFVNLILTKIAMLVAWLGVGIERLSAKAGPIIKDVISIVTNIANAVWTAATNFFKALGDLQIGATVSGFFKAIKDMTESKDFQKLAGTIGTLAGQIAGEVWRDATAFFSGLSAWLRPAVSALSDIAGSIKSIWDKIFGTTGGGLNTFFRYLGDFAGGAITGALRLVETLLDAIVAIIDYIKGDKVALAADMLNLKGDLVQFGRVFGGAKSDLAESKEEIVVRLKKEQENKQMIAYEKEDWDAVMGEGKYDEKQKRLRQESFHGNKTLAKKSAIEKLTEGANRLLYGNSKGTHADSKNPVINMNGMKVEISIDKSSVQTVLDDMTGAFRAKVLTAMVSAGMIE